MSARVFLVGAGPGDPSLLTLRAAELLRRADSVLYDALVSPEIVARARPSSEKIFAGKRRGRAAMQQDDIARLMIRRARAGKIVVRLKGGDPFIFGRGGEEALALAQAGIAFEIVPGISSVIGAAAYAGIPLTHRGASSSFHVLTGHEDPDSAHTLVDWSLAARSRGTVVLLMAMAELARITRRLISDGAPPDRPVAVIQNGTSAGQRVVTGTLASIANDAELACIGSPAIVVIGEVVRLRERIAWFEDRVPVAVASGA
ncbi:MAG TPA: uroporphyrinogen-III C-methyltransferase [Candidatus Baltobacteraceae bacterium]|jgi:uroporphyrin-III C-methyltransferase|nr:uroporphyrinogen-III C-methyltransferase [Candidatus Baltobacteraceae bacterium]